MTLEADGLPPLHNPTEEQVRDLVLRVDRMGPSFASLTDEAGDYVQLAGSRPWCLVEMRRHNPTRHERAFQHTPQPKYADGAKIITGAGEIVMKHDEWFLLKDAADIFVAFLNRQPYPEKVEWRSMNETLGI
jgi:hypothetical protein